MLSSEWSISLRPWKEPCCNVCIMCHFLGNETAKCSVHAVFDRRWMVGLSDFRKNSPRPREAVLGRALQATNARAHVTRAQYSRRWWAAAVNPFAHVAGNNLQVLWTFVGRLPYLCGVSRVFVWTVFVDRKRNTFTFRGKHIRHTFSFFNETKRRGTKVEAGQLSTSRWCH